MGERVEKGILSAITSRNFRRYLEISGRDIAERLREADHLLAPGKPFADTKILVRLLDLECAMHLDKTEQHMFALHLHKLKEVARYRNDIHLAPDQRGHVAEHSAKVVIGSDPLFEEVEPKTESLAQMRRNYHIGTYMHDLGEILGEFYSFAEENNQTVTKRLDGDTKLKLENSIAAFATKVALYAVQANDNDFYFRAIDEMREACGVNPQGGLTIDPYEAAKRIEEYIRAFPFPAIEPNTAEAIRNRIENRQNGLMRYYQQAEEYKGVGGPAVKLGQIIEGNQKFIDMVREYRAGVVPYTLATSKRILGAYYRTEPPILGLNNHAVDNDAQYQIALQRQRETYANLLSHITIEPDVLDRDALRRGNPSSDPEPVWADGMLTQAKLVIVAALESEEREASLSDDFNHAASTVLNRPTISARTRLLLYTSAWLCEDFAPLDKEPLVMKREIPDMLVPYVTILDDAFDNGFDTKRLRGAYKFDADIRYKTVIDRVAAHRSQIEGFFDDFRQHRQLSAQATARACLKVA